MKTITTLLILLFALNCQACNEDNPQSESLTMTPVSKQSVTIREYTVKTGTKSIYGKLYIPETIDGKIPVAVYSHGFGGTNSGGTEYAMALAQNGIACYCIDFCGGSPASKSSGNTTEMSIFTEETDLADVVTAVKTLGFIDPDNIFLLGSSQGGMVSAMVGAAHPEEIRGMVLYYPALCIPDTMTSLYPDLSKVGDTFDFWGIRLGRTYLEGLYGYDPFKVIGNYKGNVLIIHGDKDNVVNVDYARRAQDVYESSELVIFNGAGHGFWGDYADRSISLTLDFIKNNIAK